MKRIKYHGYLIFEDGRVIGKRGDDVVKRINDGKYEIRLNIRGKRETFIMSRLLYHVFYDFDINDRDIYVSFKDGNPMNIHLDNLFLADRKIVSKKRQPRQRPCLTSEQATEIRRKYNCTSERLSLQDLATEYGVTKTTISQSIRSVKCTTQ